MTQHIVHRFAALAGAILLATAAHAADAPRVRVTTSLGSFVIELNPERAPLTVANFLRYVKEGHYTNTLFHRVIANFVIQGGGVTPEYTLKPAHDPIPNEAKNGLKNSRGTIAMARTADPHSATAQFFINVNDNDFLDNDRCQDGWGYCVFGRVVEGQDVVDKIKTVKTGNKGFHQNVPKDDVVIERAEVV